MPQSDRAPLATYEQAVWRLAVWETSGKHSPEQLELAVQVVADVFWLSDAKVRFDLKKAVRSVDPAAKQRPRSSRAAFGVGVM